MSKRGDAAMRDLHVIAYAFIGARLLTPTMEEALRSLARFTGAYDGAIAALTAVDKTGLLVEAVDGKQEY